MGNKHLISYKFFTMKITKHFCFMLNKAETGKCLAFISSNLMWFLCGSIRIWNCKIKRDTRLHSTEGPSQGQLGTAGVQSMNGNANQHGTVWLGVAKNDSGKAPNVGVSVGQCWPLSLPTHHIQQLGQLGQCPCASSYDAVGTLVASYLVAPLKRSVLIYCRSHFT